MRALYVSAAVLALVATALRADKGQQGTSPGGKPERPECHGTSIEFVDTPVEAAKLAARQKKLVFVLHVSGYFEDPRFT